MFTEDTLREDIIKTWGPAGAHVVIFDSMIAEIETLRKENKMLRSETRMGRKISTLEAEIQALTMEIK